jgi:hypothetical protein
VPQSRPHGGANKASAAGSFEGAPSTREFDIAKGIDLPLATVACSIHRSWT